MTWLEGAGSSSSSPKERVSVHDPAHFQWDSEHDMYFVVSNVEGILCTIIIFTQKKHRYLRFPFYSINPTADGIYIANNHIINQLMHWYDGNAYHGYALEIYESFSRI